MEQNPIHIMICPVCWHLSHTFPPNICASCDCVGDASVTRGELNLPAEATIQEMKQAYGATN